MKTIKVEFTTTVEVDVENKADTDKIVSLAFLELKRKYKLNHTELRKHFKPIIIGDVDIKASI